MHRTILLTTLLAAGLFAVSAAERASAASPAQTEAWHIVAAINHPWGLAIDPRGNPRQTKWAYVVDDAARVTKFGTRGKMLGSWSYGPPPQYRRGAGITVGPGGNVFVADAASSRVLKFDPSGRRLAQWRGFQLPSAVALDRTGDVYVAEPTLLRVTKLSPSGQVLARWHVPWINGSGSGMPLALAVDRQGSVYVGANCYLEECPPPHGIQYAVIKLDASGAMQSALLGNNPYVLVAQGEEPFVTVNSVAVDAKDSLYVGGTIRSASGQLSESVLVYGGGTSLQARYALPGIDAPLGIAFDGRNALYVAQGNRILKRL
jgi:DNA-binding beta-propeller fold protein YncE